MGVDQQTTEQRTERARVLSGEQHDREIVEVERRVRREAFVDAKLDQHEDRLNAINGNIGRLASAVEAVKDLVASLVGEKKGIVRLQNQQIALIATIASVAYVLITYVH